MTRRLCGEEHYPEPLLAVAGHGLGRTRRTLPDEPLGDEDWAILLRAAHAHRVTGLLLAAIEEDRMPATGVQVQQARTAHRANAVRALALERELIGMVDFLAGRGIETRVLKGSAVAHLDYRKPALRSFIDLDILVRASDIDQTVRALTEEGFVRLLAEPRPGFDRRFDKGTTLVSPTGYELDLHRTFVLGPWGVLVDLDALWDRGQEFVIGGRPLRALTRANRFIHACYHAALGDWPLRLGSLRDIAEMLPGVDQGDEVLRRAEQWGVEAVVAAAVADARRLLAVEPAGTLSTWADGYLPSRRETAWLALYTRADKTFAAQALATLPVLPRLRDKAAYVRALVLPDRQYTAGRHSSALARFRFAVDEVRRGRGPCR